MHRIARLDAIDHLPRIPAPLVAVGAGAFGIGLAWTTRMAVDMLAPHSGPFVVNIPAILIATLMGRWLAGFITLTGTILLSWYFVLPYERSFALANPSDGPRIVVNVVIMLIVIAITELARRAVRIMVAEREEHIRMRELLLREVDHRVKNNLTILASMLSAQQRKSEIPEVREALEDARGRIFSLAKAYDYLNLRATPDDHVEMSTFLDNLVDAIRSSGISEDIRIETEADVWHLDREHAGAVGLLVNELVTNAVKHAFKDRDKGTINVTLRAHGASASLMVRDDGSGFDTLAETDGKGTAFLRALASTARAELHCDSGPGGTCYTARLNSGAMAPA